MTEVVVVDRWLIRRCCMTSQMSWFGGGVRRCWCEERESLVAWAPHYPYSLLRTSAGHRTRACWCTGRCTGWCTGEQYRLITWYCLVPSTTLSCPSKTVCVMKCWILQINQSCAVFPRVSKSNDLLDKSWPRCFETPGWLDGAYWYLVQQAGGGQRNQEYNETLSFS